MNRFCRYCTIGLVCLCCAQGAKTPPASAVAHVLTAASSTYHVMSAMPDTIIGRIYDLPRASVASRIVVLDSKDDG